MDKKLLGSKVDIHFSNGDKDSKSEMQTIKADIYLANGNIVIVPFKRGLKRLLVDSAKVAGRAVSISSVPAALIAMPIAVGLDALENSKPLKEKRGTLIEDRYSLCQRLKLDPEEVIICNPELANELLINKPEKNFLGIEKSTVIGIKISGSMSVFDISGEYYMFFFLNNKSSTITKLMTDCGIKHFKLVDQLD